MSLHNAIPELSTLCPNCGNIVEPQERWIDPEPDPNAELVPVREIRRPMLNDQAALLNQKFCADCDSGGCMRR